MSSTMMLTVSVLLISVISRVNYYLPLTLNDVVSFYLFDKQDKFSQFLCIIYYEFCYKFCTLKIVGKSLTFSFFLCVLMSILDAHFKDCFVKFVENFPRLKHLDRSIFYRRMCTQMFLGIYLSTSLIVKQHKSFNTPFLEFSVSTFDFCSYFGNLLKREPICTCLI